MCSSDLPSLGRVRSLGTEHRLVSAGAARPLSTVVSVGAAISGRGQYAAGTSRHERGRNDRAPASPLGNGRAAGGFRARTGGEPGGTIAATAAGARGRPDRRLATGCVAAAAARSGAAYRRNAAARESPGRFHAGFGAAPGSASHAVTAPCALQSGAFRALSRPQSVGLRNAARRAAAARWRPGSHVAQGPVAALDPIASRYAAPGAVPATR